MKWIARAQESDAALTFRSHTPRSPGVALEHTHTHTLPRMHMRSLAMANATPIIISLSAFSRYVPRSQCQLQRGRVAAATFAARLIFLIKIVLIPLPAHSLCAVSN